MPAPAALDGVETLLIVSASESADRLEQHRTFVGEDGVIRGRYDAWVSMYTAIKAGEFDTLTDDVRRVTGVAPTSLREHLREA